MTPYAVTLNEISPADKGCCPTDARLRPDVRMMEEGNFKEANTVRNQSCFIPIGVCGECGWPLVGYTHSLPEPSVCYQCP